MKCSGCGCGLDEDDLETCSVILADVWDRLARDERAQCEGCAEDTLESIISSDADARWLGLDYLGEGECWG